MQFSNSRRGFLVGSLAVSAGAITPAAAAALLDIPLGPMLLGRKIERDLRDGAKVIVKREWQVEFSRLESGIKISGGQISAKVKAPEKLREIARIEEERPTDGMFPIMLTGSGLIDQVEEVEDSASIEAAVREAEEVIAQLPRIEDEKSQMRQAIARLQAASNSIFDVMPPDLFFPTNTQFEDSRNLPLPDGTMGEFKLVYRARHASQGPWLDTAERHVFTQIGEDIRHSHEVWTMQAA